MMIWQRKPTVENAIRLFLELYDDNRKDKVVKKPISRALYQTWKWFDVNEKERGNKE